MDLISISRRYKNVKKILILILLLIIIIYVSLIINKYSENKRREKIYQSYEKVYDILHFLYCYGIKKCVTYQKQIWYNRLKYTK